MNKRPKTDRKYVDSDKNLITITESESESVC